MSNNIARYDKDFPQFRSDSYLKPHAHSLTHAIIPHAAPEPETEQPSPPDNNTLKDQAIETNQATPPAVSDTIQGAAQDAPSDPKEAAPVVAPTTGDAAANPDEQKAGLKEQAIETNQATPATGAQDASSDLKEAAGATSPVASAPAAAPAPAATGNAAANPFRAPGMSDEEKAERAKYAAPVAVIPDDISSKFGGALLSFCSGREKRLLLVASHSNIHLLISSSH